MIKPETIDYALTKTLEKYPQNVSHGSGALLTEIVGQQNPLIYTKDGGARSMMKGVTPDDYIRYFCTEAIKLYNSATYFFYNDAETVAIADQNQRVQHLLSVFPCYGDLQRILEKIANPDVNSSLYLKTNQQDLLKLIEAVVPFRFHPNSTYKEYADAYGYSKCVLTNGKAVDLFAKVDKDIEKVASARNVRVNNRAVNKCLIDLMNGAQLKNKRNEYALNGTLFASQDIGNVRQNQEDSVLIMQHQDNPEFKFVAISDGVGGSALGEQASSYLLQRLSQWFSSLPTSAYNDPENLQLLFNDAITHINEEIYKKYNSQSSQIRAGATFTGAIVTKDQTIISSIGDSRAYTSKWGNLQLVTRDESAVWPVGVLPTKIKGKDLDDMRFDKHGNQIYNCIGINNLGSIQSTMIKNKDYDRLLIMSDGVTDLLSYDRLKFITNHTPPEQLTSALVDEALRYDAIRALGEDAQHKGRIPAGKDNASAAAIVRR